MAGTASHSATSAISASDAQRAAMEIVAQVGATLWDVTAKEKLRERVEGLSEEEAARAQIVVVEEPESAMAPLPEGWERMANGEPMPDVAAAVRRSRESH